MTTSKDVPLTSRSGKTFEYVLVADGQEQLVTNDEAAAVLALTLTLDREVHLYLVTHDGRWLEWSVDGGWKLVFRPGAPSDGDAFETWAESVRFINESEARNPITVMIDDSLVTRCHFGRLRHTRLYSALGHVGRSPFTMKA